MTLTARTKLLVAALLSAAPPLLSHLSGGSAATTARLALAATTGLGLAAWLWRARAAAGAGGLRALPRLRVVQRLGLSGRSGLTLVEVDGRPWLVAHGDGFARMTPLGGPRLVSRRPAASVEANVGVPS